MQERKKKSSIILNFLKNESRKNPTQRILSHSTLLPTPSWNSMLKAFRTALLRNSPQHHSNRPGHFGSLETRRDEELPSFSLPSFLSSFFTVHNQSIPSRRENFRDYSRQSRSYFFYIFTTSNPIEQSLHPYYHTLRFFFFFFFFFFTIRTKNIVTSSTIYSANWW